MVILADLCSSFSAIRNVSDAMEPRQVPTAEMFQGNIYSRQFYLSGEKNMLFDVICIVKMFP